MNAGERAVALHEDHNNCAQSVIGALNEYTGLELDKCISVASGFGGGIGCGEVCGAVSGAVMTIGLKYYDKSDKSAVKGNTAEFIKIFKEKYGSIRCCELRKPGHTCTEMIYNAAEIADELIKK